MSLITYLTRIHFADRVLEDALPEEIARHRIRRPLVVADRSAEGGDGLERVFDALPAPEPPAMVFCDPDLPRDAEIAQAKSVLAKAECDGLIGFGGLRALDLARLLGGTTRPVVTIPTRTGSIGLGPLGRDMAETAAQRPALPAAILCDATLTLDTPPAATAATGMDALVHCLESFLSTAFNPPADGIALDGLRRAALHLEAAVQNGQDMAARRELLAAALNAGLASEKGYGGIEAAAHGLEASAKARHGVLHGALLSEVLSFNAPAVSDRFDLIRTTLGLPERADLGAHLAVLAERIGLPLRLSEVGITARALPRAARRAAADCANRTNPRHATASDYEKMMRAVL